MPPASRQKGPRMKKISFLPLLFLFLLLLTPALADEAKDITAEATLKASSKGSTLYKATDRDYTKLWTSGKERKPFVEVTTETPCYGVYVCFGDTLSPWVVEVKEGSKWVVSARGEGLYAHEYIALSGLTHFRITYESTKQRTLSINEMYLLSDGDVPDFVQRWQPTVEKADLMLLVAHPDDEILFFGGMLPEYAGERKMNVVVCYMTCGTTVRRSELLNGLWLCGVRTYPDIGGFWDKYALKKTDPIYDAWKGKSNVHKYVTALIRKYKPEVLVTHATNGEYGHGAHIVCADSCLTCVASAADETKFTASFSEYGAWQVKKLYLHTYLDNPITLDWDKPLANLNGRTGFEVAQQAYTLHASQPQDKQYQVEPRDSEKSSYLFGLAYSAVGEDVEKNDLFENIDLNR